MWKNSIASSIGTHSAVQKPKSIALSSPARAGSRRARRGSCAADRNPWSQVDPEAPKLIARRRGELERAATSPESDFRPYSDQSLAAGGVDRPHEEALVETRKPNLARAAILGKRLGLGLRFAAATALTSVEVLSTRHMPVAMFGTERPKPNRLLLVAGRAAGHSRTTIHMLGRCAGNLEISSAR